MERLNKIKKEFLRYLNLFYEYELNLNLFTISYKEVLFKKFNNLYFNDNDYLLDLDILEKELKILILRLEND